MAGAMPSGCCRRGRTAAPGARSSSSWHPSPTAPTPCRSRIASRSSTTTARSGPRSRCPPSCTTSCEQWARRGEGRSIARRHPAVHGGGHGRPALARRCDRQALRRRRLRPHVRRSSALVRLTDANERRRLRGIRGRLLPRREAPHPERSVRRDGVPADGGAAPLPRGATASRATSSRAATATSCGR